MWPLQELYPSGNVLWFIQKAIYGLRTSPNDLQEHFAMTLSELQFRRLQSDANVYCNSDLQTMILAYVDDLLIIGPEEHVSRTITLGQDIFLMKQTGDLDSDSSRMTFLGRQLQRCGDSILMHGTTGYYE